MTHARTRANSIAVSRAGTGRSQTSKSTTVADKDPRAGVTLFRMRALVPGGLARAAGCRARRASCVHSSGGHRRGRSGGKRQEARERGRGAAVHHAVEDRDELRRPLAVAPLFGHRRHGSPEVPRGPGGAAGYDVTWRVEKVFPLSGDLAFIHELDSENGRVVHTVGPARGRGGAARGRGAGPRTELLAGPSPRTSACAQPQSAPLTRPRLQAGLNARAATVTPFKDGRQGRTERGRVHRALPGGKRAQQPPLRHT